MALPEATGPNLMDGTDMFSLHFLQQLVGIIGQHGYGKQQSLCGADSFLLLLASFLFL
jgi:hypothetical protein